MRERVSEREREIERERERERFGNYVTSLFTEVIKHDGAEHG